MGKVQNIDPSDIYIINKESQCAALSITTSIVDANDREMFSRRSFSEYVEINCTKSLNHFPIQSDIVSKLSKTVSNKGIHDSNTILTNLVGSYSAR
jgi:hypothetical protein